MPDRRAIFLVCAFLTGFSALLYETVWQRVLGFFSGSDVVSATLVISAYLSGLAAGSFLISFFADRISQQRLVLWYGALTLGVGVFGWASIPFLYGFVYAKLGVHPLPIGWTYVVLFAATMVPTAMMGASFPLLGRLYCRERQAGAAERLALLNGVNILGAVLGALVSGWYLVGSIGFDRTTYVGAVIDAAAAVLAVSFATRVTASRSTASEEGSGRPIQHVGVAEPLHSAGDLRTWAALTLFSGFIAISLEVIWLRLLSIYIKSNSYLFAHLLAWVLFGFAVGSLLGGRIVRRRSDTSTIFLWAQIGVVSYALISNLGIAFFYHRISALLGTDILVLDPGHGWVAIATNVGRYVAIPLLVLFPATVLIGFTFPFAQRAIQDRSETLGARVGFIQAANLVGNISGGLITGLFLLDRLGSFGALRLLGVVGLAFVAPLYLSTRRSQGSRAGRYGVLPAALSLAALVIFYPSSSRLMGWIHNVVPDQPFAYSEDASGIATLTGIGQPTYRAYMLNVDALAESQVPFDFFHCYVGVMGSLLHPNPESVFMVGLGSGATPYCMGVNDQVRRIRAVEIVSAELKVLRQISGTTKAMGVDRLMMDPRYEIVPGDARKYLTEHDEQYDIIEADAVRPRRPHSGLLYSTEFFELVRTRLKPGGFFVQWHASPRVKATLLSVFPHVAAFDWILIGSNSPFAVDKPTLLERLSDPRIKHYLDVGDPEKEMINEVRKQAARSTFEYWSPSDPRGTLDVNTDLRPKDEFYMNNSEGKAPSPHR